RDDGLVERADREDVRVVGGAEHVARRARVVAKLVQVLAHAEAAPGAGDHNGSDLGVAGLLEPGRDALVHGEVDRVQNVRTVERDRENRPVPRDLDLGHAQEPNSVLASPRGLRPWPPGFEGSSEIVTRVKRDCADCVTFDPRGGRVLPGKVRVVAWPAMATLRLISNGPAPTEEAPLDAYSRVVVEVADRLAPSVANLRVSRRFRGRRGDGGGSGVVITPDAFMLTSAHVVERAEEGVASFVDGRELAIEVVGTDPLSDLAVLRTRDDDVQPAELGDADGLR